MIQRFMSCSCFSEEVGGRGRGEGGGGRRLGEKHKKEKLKLPLLFMPKEEAFGSQEMDN